MFLKNKLTAIKDVIVTSEKIIMASETLRL
jgi:hypothetical protein